ncbi:hypothetical protein K470DRAFT_257595 [Piedraia hortae CBS 480.64]|uniref:Uncharacterized protein n=1 Tax=Piedraia hortae CBS 480.64 TaxID=1314780 RepID=A0A6A7BZY8_9PEZI|nr:hypothetical protein K470DRAFT_257595 [Piedraia hortae CBS 480.64]
MRIRFLGFTLFSVFVQGGLIRRQTTPEQYQTYLKEAKSVQWAVNSISADTAPANCNNATLVKDLDKEGYDGSLVQLLTCEATVGVVVFPRLARSTRDLDAIVKNLQNIASNSTAVRPKACPEVWALTLKDAGLDGDAIRKAICERPASGKSTLTTSSGLHTATSRSTAPFGNSTTTISATSRSNSTARRTSTSGSSSTLQTTASETISRASSTSHSSASTSTRATSTSRNHSSTTTHSSETSKATSATEASPSLKTTQTVRISSTLSTLNPTPSASTTTQSIDNSRLVVDTFSPPNGASTSTDTTTTVTHYTPLTTTITTIVVETVTATS